MKSACKSVVFIMEKWRVLYDLGAEDEATCDDVHAVFCCVPQSRVGLWLSRQRKHHKCYALSAYLTFNLCPEDGGSLCLRNFGSQLPK